MTFAFIFGDVGIGEWFVLLAVILVVVGPRRLPETARKAGTWYARLRRAADSFRRELMELEGEIGGETGGRLKVGGQTAEEKNSAAVGEGPPTLPDATSHCQSNNDGTDKES